MAEASGECALFIDFENLYLSAQGMPGGANRPIAWKRLLAALEPHGRIGTRKAYANWGAYARHQSALMDCAILPVQAVGRNKNVADMLIVMDVMETLLSAPEIDTFIIASGDTDFTFLVQRLRQHRKRVIGVGVRHATATWLAQACDTFLYYDDIVATASQPAGAGAQPRPSAPLDATISHDEEGYIAAARRQQLYIWPDPRRPEIVFRAYELMTTERPPTLTALKERLHDLYADHPEIDSKVVQSVIYQLFYAFIFEIDRQGEAKLWDRPFALAPAVTSRQEMLRLTDLDVLRRIARELPGGAAALDPAVAARVLYARDDHPAILERVAELKEALVASDP